MHEIYNSKDKGSERTLTKRMKYGRHERVRVMAQFTKTVLKQLARFDNNIKRYDIDLVIDQNKHCPHACWARTRYLISLSLINSWPLLPSHSTIFIQFVDADWPHVIAVLTYSLSIMSYINNNLTALVKKCATNSWWADYRETSSRKRNFSQNKICACWRRNGAGIIV